MKIVVKTFCSERSPSIPSTACLSYVTGKTRFPLQWIMKALPPRMEPEHSLAAIAKVLNTSTKHSTSVAPKVQITVTVKQK
jgi:hypothetical protein